MQGDFREHLIVLRKLGVSAIEVKSPEDMSKVDGLIIPGGESTTIGKLMSRNGLDREIKVKHSQGIPIYGTCAGVILMAKEIEGSKQPRLAIADISVARNAYGGQLDSFEADILFQKSKLHSVFIRAPIISRTSKGVEVLAYHKKNPVLLRQGNLLMSTFHPELTQDARIHKYFLGMCSKRMKGKIH